MSSESTVKASSVQHVSDMYARSYKNLLHLASLSQTGKGRLALEQLVLVATHLECEALGRSVTSGEVEEALTCYFGFDSRLGEVESCLDRHSRAGEVSKRDGRFRLTSHADSRIRDRIATSQQLEVAVQIEWIEQIGAVGDLTSATLWECLRGYTARVFQLHGALSLELLDPSAGRGATEDEDTHSLLLEAVSAADVELSEALEAEVEAAVATFFRTKTAKRSKYLAELLNGTFTFFSLHSDAVGAAYNSQMLPLSLFLDTNFIFSLIGADGGAPRAQAEELVAFIVDNELPCTLYYHESTLKEVERTLDAVRHHLCSRRWSTSTSAAAVKTGTGSGITLRYHEINAKTPISPRLYMDRYSNVVALLEEHGAKIYRSTSLAENDLEEISTFIADYGKYVEGRRREAKPYEALDHDARVLIAVREKRRRLGSGTTALDAGAFMLSNDRLLRQFSMRHSHSSRVPALVLPQQLMQVLRPFGPPDNELDAKFVETFAVPEFRSAVSDYTDTSAKMLEFLALYEDLPERTAVRLLRNQMLMDQLATTGSDGDFQSRIEAEIVKENAELIGDGEQLRTQVVDLQRQLNEEGAERERLADRERELLSSMAVLEAAEPVAGDLAVAAESDRLKVKYRRLVSLTWSVIAVFVAFAIPSMFDIRTVLGVALEYPIQSVVAATGICLSVIPLRLSGRAWAAVTLVYAGLTAIVTLV